MAAFATSASIVAQVPGAAGQVGEETLNGPATIVSGETTVNEPVEAVLAPAVSLQPPAAKATSISPSGKVPVR